MAQYFQPNDTVGTNCQEAGFSNAVTIPANAKIVITAGQAGVDRKTGKLVETSIADQIEAAFEGADLSLKAAGVTRGLAGAHKILTFLIDMRYESVMMDIWQRLYPNHRPTWTCVGVSNFSMRGMFVEMQAEAILE
ncbi:YjgF-like protein [Xylariaceae sp. FL1272]|nr:YjgF-like protein [Xylariaceae sp. FL1272]